MTRTSGRRGAFHRLAARAAGLALLLAMAALDGVGAEESREAFQPDPGMINANDTAVLEPGQVEILGGHVFNHADGFFDDRSQRQPGPCLRSHSTFLQVTAGVVEDVDVTAVLGDVHGVDFGQDPDGDGNPDRLAAHGTADAVAGVRWRFYQGGDTSAAFLAYAALPTGPSAGIDRLGLSQEFASLTPRLVLSRNWGRLNAVADLGYSFPLGANAPGARGGLSTVLGAGYHVTDSIKPLVEVGYSNARFDGASLSESLSLTGGVALLLSEDAQAYLGLTRVLAGRNTPDLTSGTFYLLFTF